MRRSNDINADYVRFFDDSAKDAVSTITVNDKLYDGMNMLPQPPGMTKSAVPLLTARETLLNGIGQLRGNQNNTVQPGVLPTFSHLNILEAVHQSPNTDES